MPHAVTLDDIRAAAERLRGFAHRTPVLTCATIDALAGRSVHFKCENLQKTGSFKYRGATNAVRRLDDATAARGVVTHSSGNHAQALALAAKLRNIPATVVMPRTASAIKRAAVVGYGATVIECEPTLAERERVAGEVVVRTGGTLIPPFDHADVIAGQGTACLELLESVPGLDAVVAPVGGGGLLSGFAVAAKGTRESLRVYGAEPRGADDAARSLASGVWQPQLAPVTIADGLDEPRPPDLADRPRPGGRHLHRERNRNRRGDAARLGSHEVGDRAERGRGRRRRTGRRVPLTAGHAARRGGAVRRQRVAGRAAVVIGSASQEASSPVPPRRTVP